MKHLKFLLPLITLLLLQINLYSKDFSVKTGKNTFYFSNQKEVDLFKEYNKLFTSNEKLSEVIAKSKNEFISNIIKTKRFDRYKTEEKKVSKAQKSWNSSIKKLSKGEEYTGYKYIAQNTPKLMAYINKNYLKLSQDKNIGEAIELIKINYEIAEDKKEIAEDKKEIAEDKKEIAEDKKIIKSYKNVLKQVGK